MPVTYKHAPDDVRREAMLGLTITRDQSEGQLLAADTPWEREYEVFTLDPSDVIEAEDLKVAQAVGWHFSSSRSAVGPSVIEILTTSGSPRFSHRQRGLFPASAERLMVSLEASQSLSNAQQTTALLRVPALARTDAIWLREGENDADSVFPIASASPLLVSGQSYSVPSFLNILREINRRQTQDNVA